MSGHKYTRWQMRLTALAIAFAIPIGATAQDPGGAFPIDSTYQTISNWVLIAAEFLNVLTWFVFSFLVFLLDPTFIFDMTNGKDGSLMVVLNEIWQVSRDIMNIGFALGLIGAAIYTVVTANKEFVSAHLKTFVLAVVLVNFSWFIPRVVLDIANVATVSVYSIPGALVNPAAECRYTSTSAKGCFDRAGDTCACKAVADFKPFPDTATRDSLRPLGTSPEAWDCNIAYCVRYVKLDPAKNTKHGTIINGLVVNHARLSQLAVITRTKVNNDISDLLLFILREMIVIVIHIALLFPLAALVVALILRIPILWLTIAFMPFYFLSWVVPDEIPFLGELKQKTKMIWDWFLKAAFLPAVVAIPLVVGFIMANAGTRVNFAGMASIPFNLIDGMGSFAQLLWVLMVLAILWSGTFAALEMMMGELPGGSVIQSIKSTGEEAGKFAAELPLSTVPIPGVGNVLNLKDALRPSALRRSLRSGGLGGIASSFGEEGAQRRTTDTAADKIATDAGVKDKLTDALTKFTAGNNAETIAAFNDLRQALMDAGATNVSRENLDTVVRDIHESMRRNHNTELLPDLNAFNTAIEKMRAANPPPAPPPVVPPPVAPPPNPGP